MADLFALLADGRRRALLTELAHGERSVGELVEASGIDQPAVSKHLRTLREGGVVAARVDGQRRVYRLEPGALAALEEWLAPFRRRDRAMLDALERHLDTTRPDTRLDTSPDTSPDAPGGQTP